MKNVVLASSAGFCFGVRRAIDIAEQNSSLHPVIFGNLVHNSTVISDLREKGITNVPVGAKDQLSSQNIIITAHGVADSVISGLRSENYNVIDTTCPLVKAVHILGRKLEAEGYQVVIYGEPSHVEVKGTAGNLRQPIIVNSIADAEKLEHFPKLGLISQTTASVDGFSEMAEYLKTKTDDLKVQNTICYPTKDRQAAAEELAKKVDLMIVIGSQMSSNSRKLHDLCSKYVKTYQVEKSSQLLDDWFEGMENIGVTAGASTPDKDITEIVEKIREMD